MRNNYPPGVYESDIPGSRPEDVALEKLLEKFYTTLSEDDNLLIDEQGLGELLEKAVQFGMSKYKEDLLRNLAEKRYYLEEYHEDTLSSIARMLYWRTVACILVLHKADRDAGTEKWEIMVQYGLGGRDCLSSGVTTSLTEAIGKCYVKVQKLTEHDEEKNQEIRRLAAEKKESENGSKGN